jgi:hypothetical protein
VGILSGAQVGTVDFVGNIVAVSLGNTLGGVIVAFTYYLAFLDDGHQPAPRVSTGASHLLSPRASMLQRLHAALPRRAA